MAHDFFFRVFKSVPAGWVSGWRMKCPSTIFRCYGMLWDTIQQFTQIWIHVFSSQTFILVFFSNNKKTAPKVLAFLLEKPQNRGHPGNQPLVVWVLKVLGIKELSPSLGCLASGCRFEIAWKIWNTYIGCPCWKLGYKWLENGLPSSKTNMALEIHLFQ